MNAHPERIGPYRILGQIGEGGFGQVFKAVHDDVQQLVAIKVLSPKSLAHHENVVRFVREAIALESFKNHRGIVQVQHFDRTQLPPYLVMELLEGKTLRQWLVARGGPISWKDALWLGEQIAATMVSIHHREWSHRDLKPENIMLVDDAASKLTIRPILLDFGIAKITLEGSLRDRSVNQVKTTGTNILGSIGYMAPEQIVDADNATPKVDVYSLGLIVYELIAGKPPFVSNNEVELVFMHVRDPPVPLRSLVPDVPAILSTFLTSMLAKKPEDRPSMRDCEVMFGRDFSLDEGKCPFPGLQPFNDSLAHLFFGRSVETDFIRRKLAELREASTRRWLQIQGSSGAGKSSFVHAAIVPKLDSKQWSILKMRPGEDPIRGIAGALAADYGANAKELAEALRQRPEALHDFILEHINDDKRILLVIDQFEELFALGGAHIETFERILRHTLQNPDSPLRLLTTIRSDYLHRFDLALDLAKLLDTFAVRYDLRPMDENALSEVIDGMAKAAGLRLANGLTRRMVQDASGNDYRLPLVGHALRSLWTLKDTGEITHADYEEMGGVGGALTKQAKEMLESESLGAGGREAAKWMLLDLVQVGQGAPDTRRPRTRAEIEKAVGKSEDALRAWKCLLGEEAAGSGREPFRLLVTSGDAADSAVQRVELVHEMVLHKVPLVVEWINAERDLLQLLAALESAALEWQKAESKDGLPSGTLLMHYRGGKKDPERRARVLRMASEGAREFLNEALRVEKRAKQAKWAIRAALAVMIVAIAVSAGVAWQQKKSAERTMGAFQEINRDFIGNLDWELGWRPYTADIRGESLAELDQNLVALEEHDPGAVYSSLVETKHHRSELARKHETFTVAYEFLIEAKRRIESKLEKDPNDYESLRFLAMHYSKHGKVMLAQGKYDGALGDFMKSVEILENLKRNHHGVDEQVLATSQLECGDAEFNRGHAKEALEWYGKALTARISRRNSDELPYWRSMTNETRIRKARAQAAMGDKSGARATLLEALEKQVPVTRQEPHSVLHIFHWAHIELELGKLDPIEGKEHFEKARDLAERILVGDTKHKEYALLLIEVLAALEKAGGDAEEAKKAKARRCEIIRDFAARDKEDRRFDLGGCN